MGDDLVREADDLLLGYLRSVTEEDAYANPWTFGQACRAAADRIEALTAERDTARASLASAQERIAALEAGLDDATGYIREDRDHLLACFTVADGSEPMTDEEAEIVACADRLLERLKLLRRKP